MLKLSNIVKQYGEGLDPVLKGINIEFRQNEFVSILGPSGCGKTTLLNIIGGLDKYTAGDLIIKGKSTKDYTDKDWDAYRNRSVGFVFQSYNLIPHLSVLENVSIALALSGTPKADENSAYFYDYSAISPDGEYLLTVKYHDLEADGIKIKNEKDYILYYGDIKTEKYWQDGYRHITGSNIFVGDNFCYLTNMCSDKQDDKAVEMGQIFLANQLLNDRYVLLIEYTTPYSDIDHSVWDCFYSGK